MPTGSISIILPTKNRPKQLVDMINSCLTKSDKPDLIDFILYVDHNDKSLKIPGRLSSKVKIITGAKAWLSIMYNTASTQASGEILMYGSDDIIFISQGWDTSVRKAFSKLNNGFGLVFPNDLSTYQGKLATHGFITRKWVDTFGYFLPPYFPDVYTDTWLTKLAEELNCLVYLENVIIEHNQYRQNKSEFDQTYRERIPSTRIRRPAETFKKLHEEIRIDILIASLEFNYKLKLTHRYLLSTIIYKFKKKSLSKEEKIILLSTKNTKVAKLFVNRILNSLK